MPETRMELYGSFQVEYRLKSRNEWRAVKQCFRQFGRAARLAADLAHDYPETAVRMIVPPNDPIPVIASFSRDKGRIR